MCLKKYLERLLIFSIIAHFAYNFCFGISLIPLKDSMLNQTSIIWPLFLSVIGLWVEDQEWKDVKKIGCIKKTSLRYGLIYFHVCNSLLSMY